MLQDLFDYNLATFRKVEPYNDVEEIHNDVIADFLLH